MTDSCLFLFTLILSMQLKVLYKKIRRPLFTYEVTNLPTEPQLLPHYSMHGAL